MNKQQQERNRHIAAMLFSISLHMLMLIGAYYFLIKGAGSHPTTAYRVQISREIAPIPSPTTPPTETTTQQQEIESNEQPIATVPDSKIPLPEPEQPHEEEPMPPQTSVPADTIPPATTQPSTVPDTQQEPTPPVIDERSLYHTDQDKKSGATLELVGWIWDQVPQPKDNTQETGKIVFEITIDNLGEIVSVRTLEKTVSPLLEQIYKDAVAQLTFSKTTENKSYAARSKGKVTFIIQAK